MSERLAKLSREERRKLVQQIQHRRQEAPVEGAPARQTIPRRGGEGPAPLSFEQQRLWFLDQLEPDNVAYNIFRALRMNGRLDIPALAWSLREIARRHEALRTTFGTVDDQPVQVVGPPPPAEIPTADLASLPAGPREALVRRLADEEAKRPFDLARGPLLRTTLLRVAPGDHVLLLTTHHIISDGLSVGIFVRELMALYESSAAGRPARLPELPIQYADFAHWQREWLQGEVYEEKVAYWRKKLGGTLPVLDLPMDRQRSVGMSHRGSHKYLPLAAPLVQRLRALSRERGATLFITLLAAFDTLLHRYSGQDDILVGAPVSNRNRLETEGLIGFFVNTLVLRNDLSGDPTFEALVDRARDTVLEASAHQELPFEKLVEEIRPDRDMSRPPVFQAVFALLKDTSMALELPGLSLSALPSESGTARMDLALEYVETSAGIVGQLEYSTDLFDSTTMERLVAQMDRLLRDAAHHPRRRLSELALLTGAELHQLLVEWNDTAGEGPASDLIHRLFEAQARTSPSALAVVFEDRHLTYAELDRQSDRLAHHLRSLGVGPEDGVGLVAERSPEAIVGILAILKAGGCYVPVDPEYPAERIAFLLDDAQVAAVLTQERLLPILPAAGRPAVLLDAPKTWTGAREDGPPEAGLSGDSPVYVIYTSGSMGRPKGVVGLHRALAGFSLAIAAKVGLAPGERMLEFASLSFDASALQIFPTLLSGATLVLDRHPGRLSPPEILALCERQGVTVLDLPAAVWRQWVDEMSGQEVRLLPGVRVFMTGGESLSGARLRSWASLPAHPARLLSSYGPTETTVTATLFSIDSDAVEGFARSKVPMGRPLPNVRIRVLDAHGGPVPIGVPGEVWIGGPCVTRGYLRRPDLTAAAFAPEAHGSERGERLYRTGDLARYLPDGHLEFLGRADHQVKIRGFRVEPGEIETLLAAHPAVREAVVSARPAPSGETRLVAHVLPEPGSSPGVGELRAYLGERLPDHMVPSAFVILSEMPLLPSGKVDRKALPEPDTDRPELAAELVSPRGPLEQAVAGIWSRVLGIDRIGAFDNFFELGGHSLLATRLLTRIRQELAVDLELRTVFESPTVAGLAAVIASRGGGAPRSAGTAALSIPRRAETAPAPLSFGQQRLWFLQQLAPESVAYHVSQGVRLAGDLDARILAAALGEVVHRHEALRTVFATVDERPVQIVRPYAGLELPRIDLTGLPAELRETEAAGVTSRLIHHPFDLSAGPLLRTALLRLAADDHVLALAMHHIVSDGWSMGVLVRELTALYGSFAAGRPSPLPELPIQYADFATWQRATVREEVLESQIRYWREALAGAPTLLDLPTDRPRPAFQSFRGAGEPLALDRETTAALRELSQSRGATPFLALMAALGLLLHRYTHQQDVLIGSPVANRSWPETEELIGFFVNTLVLRVGLSGDPSFPELLDATREAMLGADEHQDLPFEQLVDALDLPRDLSRSPLFQVMLAYQSLPPAGEPPAGITLGSFGLETRTTQFELHFSLVESPQGIGGFLNYRTDLFDAATIERLSRHFRTLLGEIARQPGRPVSELPMLAAAEREEILRAWNDTETPYPQGFLLHELVSAQVERSPEAPAVVFEGGTLTFRELDRRANRLANRLRALGCAPDSPVGVLLERSAEMVVALLGTLKAGCAYLPLDPEYPRERLAWMIEDAGLRALLSQQRLLAGAAPEGVQVVLLEEGWTGGDGDPGAPARLLPDEGLAYVIYTSGSTGRPKGVMVPHRGIVNRLLWMQEAYGLTPEDRVLQKTPFGFDVSVWELFWPLLTGATLVMARPGGHRDASYLAETIARERITVLHFVPSMLQIFLEEPDLSGCGGVRRVVCSGEALPEELRQRFRERLDARLENLYGPTEASVDVTFWSCDREGPRGSVPIGHPIANTRIHLLDWRGEPVPAGVPGELHIAGTGLARGYLGRPDLTAQSFVPDPFGAPGERLYRTGDLARYLPGGAIEFLGRIDHQVKIRGFRIELGEIEAVLATQPGVREAVVVALGEGAERRLAAYLVPGAEAAPDEAELVRALRERLPPYMVPAAFVTLERLPLSPNGKVDRRALPAPDGVRPGRGAGFVPPRGPVEQILAGIWARVLGIERVGAFDSFFDLGGHSLNATQVITRVRQALDVQLQLRQIFEATTVAELAAAILADPERRRQVEATAELSLQLSTLSDEEVENLLLQEASLSREDNPL
ncbi:MAG TPA: amino acid adenylation domain-containing protein [Thermoanaerobaculia bacterium]|nr:amino acid adenylation domain-containing protein [Thermoanaerobaculia bacterium]